MADILDQAYMIVQCKECPWYKSCTMPMRFTAEDMRRQIESGQAMGFPGAVSPDMQQMLSGMVSSAQNSLLEGCPIFIERLRTSPRLAQKIKELMQNWSKEEEKNP